MSCLPHAHVPSIDHELAHPEFGLTVALTFLEIFLLLVDFYVINVLQHLIIKLVRLVLEEITNLLTSQVHCVLSLYFPFLHLIQKFNHIVNAII